MRLSVCIGAGVLCLVALLLRMPLRLRVRYNRQTKVRLSYLFFFKNLSEKSGTTTSEREHPSDNPQPNDAGRQIAASVLRNLRDLERHFPSLKLRIRSFLVLIASNDPAKTAVLYELLCISIREALAYLTEYLPRFQIGRGDVLPDFVGTESEFSIDLVLSASVLDVLRFLYQATTCKNSDEEKVEVVR